MIVNHHLNRASNRGCITGGPTQSAPRQPLRLHIPSNFGDRVLMKSKFGDMTICLDIKTLDSPKWLEIKQKCRHYQSCPDYSCQTYSRPSHEISCLSAGGVIKGVTTSVTSLFKKVTFLFRALTLVTWSFSWMSESSIINSKEDYGFSTWLH